MIKKVLIANRGEIVQRIIRTCKKLGIQTVVVYTDADENMPYVTEADEAYHIGPSAPVKSYLNIDVLLEVIQKSDVDAVHPGYGFLSESATFAIEVEKAGVKWIGPNPNILGNIESKCFCRMIADEIKVSCTPGTIKPIKSIEEIYETAQKVGLPVLMKLDKGGGGKGIQKIESLQSKAETKATYESMQRIGMMAFASDEVYIEKAVENPRHIEIQFIADQEGNVLCLGERECSIQRRYQKLIEEAPSVVVSQKDREKLYESTRRLIQKMNYTGAGTVEYLRDKDGNYYFMEINARLQVEHPVSEMITHIDIVEWQMRIASGETLDIKQEDIQLNGHAIECRIYAEDPETFMPMMGTLKEITFPELRDGVVRVEHALSDGFKISPFYDPMICKLITWGKNRNESINHMKKALKSFELEGITTTIPVDLEIMENRYFLKGDFDTSFLTKEKMMREKKMNMA